MILIAEEIINDMIFRYYNGIDLDVIKNHPKDGSGGFIVFLIESYVKEIKNQNRERKLNSILNNKKFIPIDTDEIIHDFVGVYQYEGVGLNTMIDIVKEQMREYKNHTLSRNINDLH